MSYDNLKNVARNYLDARHQFIEDARYHPELSGNDNIIGRIGEMIAVEFLFRTGCIAKKNLNKTQKGYYLETEDGSKISVKIITHENVNGRTSKIRKPWSELILIALKQNYRVDRIGFIKAFDFQRAVQDGVIKEEPYVNKKMLEDNGLFKKYGQLLHGDIVNEYL